MDGVSEASSPFGDYIPEQILSETGTTRTWLAEQASVGRMVLIEELKEEAAPEADAFLADVRAMAAVEHPSVGSVYEACTENGRCYYAHELLPGETLLRSYGANARRPVKGSGRRRWRMCLGKSRRRTFITRPMGTRPHRLVSMRSIWISTV